MEVELASCPPAGGGFVCQSHPAAAQQPAWMPSPSRLSLGGAHKPDLPRGGLGGGLLLVNLFSGVRPLETEFYGNKLGLQRPGLFG